MRNLNMQKCTDCTFKIKQYLIFCLDSTSLIYDHKNLNLHSQRYLLLITVVLKNEGIKKFLDKEGIKNILTKEDSLSYATMEEERSSVKMIVGHGRRNSWRSLNSQYQLTERKQ